MKGILSVTILAAVFTVFLSGCFTEDVADITVVNNSEYEVKDITLSYSDTNGEQTKRIDVLQAGQRKTISVQLQEKAVQTYTTGVKIVYYIDGAQFDIKNLENGLEGSDGIPYTNAIIGGGNNMVFTIKNTGYEVGNNK
jgi:hypothetical protein